MEEMKIYTPEQAAERLQMSVKFVYEKARSGELPCSHFGRIVRISEANILEYLERTRSGQS